MSKGTRENMSWLIPYLTVVDVDKATSFYNKAFGFEVTDTAPGPDGTTFHGEMRYKDITIMCGKEGVCEGDTSKTPNHSGAPSAICLYVFCENVDELCRNACKEGAILLQEPTDSFWGDRVCQLKDIDGHVWSFATPLNNQ